eukprot:3109901-Prymnesium_polylepis.2
MNLQKNCSRKARCGDVAPHQHARLQQVHPKTDDERVAEQDVEDEWSALLVPAAAEDALACRQRVLNKRGRCADGVEDLEEGKLEHYGDLLLGKRLVAQHRRLNYRHADEYGQVAGDDRDRAHELHRELGRQRVLLLLERGRE